MIAATNDSELNYQVFLAAQEQHRLVNVHDDQPHCSYIFPSIIDRSPVQIAISSGGTAPVLARLLREKLEALLPQNLALMAQISGRWRRKLKPNIRNLANVVVFGKNYLPITVFSNSAKTNSLLKRKLCCNNSLNKIYRLSEKLR